MSGKCAKIGECEEEPWQYHFVMVHGYESGAWSWYKVRTLLEASGFKVTCLDLKASGIDLSPVESVKTFDDYNQPLTHFFHHYSPTHPREKVILVGHSAGGLSVTDATYKYSNKIDVAVYVAATMLKHGFLTHQDIIDGVPGQYDPGLGPEANGERSSIPNTIDNSNSKKKNNEYIPPEDMVLDRMLRRKGPLTAILGAKFKGSDEEVDWVPRVYISTLKDEVLTQEQQEAMIRRWAPERVLYLESGHTPNFSAPFLLAGLLANLTHLCFAQS